jgi:hypothetical protein
MVDAELNFTRCFGWGIVIVRDADSRDMPVEPAVASAIAVASGTAVVVNVLHASDATLDENPAQVTIEAFLGPAPTDRIDFRADLSITSGKVVIGDAEDEAELALAPGLWRLAVQAHPVAYPELVRLWFERLK